MVAKSWYFTNDHSMPMFTRNCAASCPIMSHTSMDELPDKEAFQTELGQWLKCDSRCFGDKGDVEDITEG